MGLNDKLKKKNTSTLCEDIKANCEWVVTALNSSGYKADYTLESMKEIDRFIDEQSGENGIISRNRGVIIFSLGCYVGETVIRLCGGKWHTDDNDPQGEINASVELDNGTVIFPMQRVIKRYQNGSEDGIYAYVYALAPDKTENKTAAPSEIIHTACEMIVSILDSSGYKMDYSLESMKEIDRFFDEPSEENGKYMSQILVSLSCYVGETVSRLYGGKWNIDDSDPNGYVSATVTLDNGTVVFPMQIVLNRFQNGSGNSIYDHVCALSQDKTEITALTPYKDIHKAALLAFERSGYKVDHSIESLKEMDRFIEEQSGRDGMISLNSGAILFSVGCYIGAVVTRLYGGEWITDDNDTLNEMIRLDNGTEIFLMQIVLNRYRNGSEDSIYDKVCELLPDKTKL